MQITFDTRVKNLLCQNPLSFHAFAASLLFLLPGKR